MNQDLAALAGITDKSDTNGNDAIDFDFGAFIDRLNTLEEKIDKILELSAKDVKIDKSNNEKESIAEAEGKIEENEEYREADENKREDNK